jgi:YD repeat-containing protein
VTDPLGHTARYIYNAEGQLTSADDFAGNAVMTIGYNANGQTSIVMDGFGNGTIYTYDNYTGELIRTASTSSGVIDLTYDTLGRERTRTSYWNNPLDPNDVRSLVTTTEYDTDGRVTRIIDPQGHETLTSYDPAGQVAGVTDVSGHVTQYLYDLRGALIETRRQAVDSQNNTVWLVSRTAYDAAGRAIAESDQYIDGSIRLGDRPRDRRHRLRPPVGSHPHLAGHGAHDQQHRVRRGGKISLQHRPVRPRKPHALRPAQPHDRNPPRGAR